MSDLTAFVDYWRIRIERDVRPFADPGTKLNVETEGRAISARWVSRHQSFEARFLVAPETGVTVSFRGQNLSYRSFLASPEMADLLSIAKMVLQTRMRTIFVETRAKYADSEKSGPAVSLLSDLLEAPDAVGLTRIVMVTGEAGAGKTSVLQELVRDQAERYVTGQTELLYLYINAQGRALARFNEALAAELQDLRAIVTYHAIATLVRAGILVPVIDGFDELLGVGGYDDAFSSLSGFIEELNGEGQIVASARSSYYEQEFVARASSVSSLGSQAWSQIPIEVQAWDDNEFREYLRARTVGRAIDESHERNVRDRVEAAFAGANHHLRQKPLFVARTVDLVLIEDIDLQSGSDLLEQLVNAYLERERREKLLNRTGEPLLSTDDMFALLTDLAEEMWNQETRELDKRSVKEVAEYALVTRNVEEVAQQVVIERMPTLAFLKPGELPGGVAFEHEMFFSYFLSRRFVERLGSRDPRMSVTLGRSILPTEVADSTVEMLWRDRAINGPILQELLDKLAASAIFEGPRSTQVRENAGLIGATALREASVRGLSLSRLRVRALVFPGVKFGRIEMSEGTFDDVMFRRVDLTRARFLRCRANNVLLHEVTVDPAVTRLELVGLDPAAQIQGLRRVAKGAIEAIYDPDDLANVLIACGALPPAANTTTQTRPIRVDVVEIVQRLARAYNRANPVCVEDGQLKHHLFDHDDWPTVRRLLLQHAIVVSEVRPTHGRPKEFLRRQFLPEQIMSGASHFQSAPPGVTKFWDALEHQFPAGVRSGG